MGEEEDAHLEDFIQDEEAGVPVDEAGRELLRRELANVLKSLTPREERVLTLRFGLEDGQARTGRAGKGIQRDPGTHPADRGEGFAETAASEPQPEIKRLS